MPKSYSAPPAMAIDLNKKYTATISTSKGDIVVELFPADAPMTVNNFVFLAREGFYDGTVFHRVIGLQVSRRNRGQSAQAWHGHTFHGERRTEHERFAVLYHPWSAVSSRWQAHRFRSSRLRAGSQYQLEERRYTEVSHDHRSVSELCCDKIALLYFLRAGRFHATRLTFLVATREHPQGGVCRGVCHP